MKNTILIFAAIAILVFSGCDQTKLTNDDARLLIIKTLNLPITYRHDIDKRPSMGSGFELDGLRSAGLITGGEYLDVNTLIEIRITKIGKSSFLGENNTAYMFKTNDIDFDQITGISINKEEQTATVRFSLKVKNATLAAYALAKTKAGFSGNNYINYSLINPLNGELVFKKFDNGWQLLEQGKSSSDLLSQILDSDANSNRQDDYTKLISDKRDEIVAEISTSQAQNSKDNLNYLEEYNGKQTWATDIFDKEPFHNRLKKLVGGSYEQFIANIQTQAPIVIKDQILFVSGCYPHSCGSDESAIAIDLKNNFIFIAILSSGKLHTFYEEEEIPLPSIFKEHISQMSPL